MMKAEWSTAAVSWDPLGLPRVKRDSYRPQTDDLADTQISDFKTFEQQK